ncbi:MAG: M23 family metallopeptidase [Marinilabiliaceae bacterium]|nr:M23 family metallopeptidase [Marinilabiliaceae bacterium]
MSKVKYRYNPETLSYDRIKTGFKYYLSRSFFFMLTVLVFSTVMFFAYHEFFDSPKEKRLMRENKQTLAQIEIMSRNLDQVQAVLADLTRRDENIYRVIFSADSIPNSIRMAGFGGVNRYSQLENLTNSELVTQTAQKLDIIMKQAYVQSKSFDEIERLAKDKDLLLKATPSIMPISNKDLTRTASGWGWRIHPIYKIKKFHEGMDFSAPTGTEIYATGDGVVVKRLSDATGYGNRVEIDHGFGYTTLYAHMDRFNVQVGQKVKRGDVIGYVGDTGTSTAPHLHYEVHKQGRKVNPAHYYFQDDLTPEEYERMIIISSNSNQTFD